MRVLHMPTHFYQQICGPITRYSCLTKSFHNYHSIFLLGSFGLPENRRSSCWEGKRKSRTKKKINSEQIFPGAFFHTFFRLSSSSRHPPRLQKCQSKFNCRVLVHEKYRVLLKVVIKVTLFFSGAFFHTFFCLSSSSRHLPRLQKC